MLFRSEQSTSRSEMVATFLALLAMVKAKRITVEGEGENAAVTLVHGREEAQLDYDE